MIRPPASRAAFFLAAAVMVSGCASYRLGPVNPAIPAGQAIEVGLFQNATPQPGLTESVNASIRRELQRDDAAESATARHEDRRFLELGLAFFAEVFDPHLPLVSGVLFGRERHGQPPAMGGERTIVSPGSSR